MTAIQESQLGLCSAYKSLSGSKAYSSFVHTGHNNRLSFNFVCESFSNFEVLGLSIELWIRGGCHVEIWEGE